MLPVGPLIFLLWGPWAGLYSKGCRGGYTVHLLASLSNQEQGMFAGGLLWGTWLAVCVEGFGGVGEALGLRHSHSEDKEQK